jgi:predicted DNA-binding transcriptional regulator YafY
MEKLNSLQYYVESKTCVTVGCLAMKLEVSERTIYRMIRHLKIKDIDIQHCKRKSKYFIPKQI